MGLRTVKVLPWQGEFLKAEDRIAGVIGGLGSGKTWTACSWLIDRVIRWPRGNHCIAGIDLPQLKRGSLMSLRAELENRDIAYSYNRAEGILTIRDNGCTLLPLTSENFQAWRSLEADSIWADEIAVWGPNAEEAFLLYLLPRVRYSPLGKRYITCPRDDRGTPLHAEGCGCLKPMLRFTTNPPLTTANWLYELLCVRQPQFPLDQRWKYWQVSTRDNVLLEEQDTYLRMLEAAHPPDVWPILIDGQWGNALAGLVYKGFDPGKHCWPQPEFPTYLPRVQIDPTKPISWCLDFNVGYMCSLIAQVHSNPILDAGTRPLANVPEQRVHQLYRYGWPDVQGRLFYALDEIRLPDSGTPDVIKVFLERYGNIAKQTGVILYGDASGGSRAHAISAQSAARSNWALIIEALVKYGIRWEWRVPSVNPSVMDRINAVKAQLRTGEGIGTIIHKAGCQYFVRDLETVKWVQGRNELDKRTDLSITHLSDAWGYFVWVERQLAQHRKVDWLTLSTNR